ncbi:unnamed protein product [Nippostrongylus brasiliensis]|uniref:Uncharacterized protein n=1 Tax=Nippostrongylus brasiliensis TaxID=27835 RepID=A0A0N4Y5V2_NIPBR|nr:unnamed protein product [Nippostrongylus brasiliensis]
MFRSLPDKPLAPRKKRKRRRHRKHGIGPHTIVGSLNDYFAKMQVFSYSHYMELRKEYLALRRQSQTQTNQLSRENFRFEGFRTFGGKLRHKLESYRDRFWDADHVEED